MIFKNLFKKFKKTQIKKPEKISLEDLKEILDNKIKENKEKQSEISKEIKEKARESGEELNNKINILQEIDLKDKKAKHKVKLVVKKNLDNYMLHAKNLANEIINLKSENLDFLIKYLNSSFSSFEKDSYMNYQKATILIGKELENTKNIFINFYKYINKKYEENKELILEYKSLLKVKSKWEHLRGIEERIKKEEKELNLIEDKINSLKSRKSKQEENLNQFKKSEKYSKIKEKEKEIKTKKEKIENKIEQLKQEIDFKKLANILHKDQEKMNLLKKCKENFLRNFKEDKGKKIKILLQGTSLETEKAIDKITKIIEGYDEIEEIEKSINKKDVDDILKETERANSELDTLENEKEMQEKKLQKFQEDKKETMKTIKEELNNLNILLKEQE